MALSATETGGSTAPSTGTESVGRIGRMLGRGKSEAPVSPRAAVAHVEGYSGLRLTRPESTPKRPGGKDQKIESREHGITTELAGRFSTYLHDDLDKLIGMEQDLGARQFRQLMNESGHGYYVRLFDELTEAKAGTSGRSRSINTAEFKKFMATDAGLTIAYQVAMRKLQDKAVPAAILIQMQSPSPQPGMVEEQSVTTGKGGVLREATRWTRHALTQRVDRHYERESPTRLSAGGRVHGLQSRLDVLGATGALSGVGALLGVGIAHNPMGAVIGGAIAPIGVGVAYASRRGETLNLVQSAKAIRGVIGDPYSGDPNSQVPCAEEVEFMQRFHGIDPHDIVIAGPYGNETVNIKPGAVNTNIDRLTLAEDLNGYARDIMKFQAANHMRRNQIEPMDIAWLIEGRDNPNQQGTPMQQRVMEQFRTLGGVVDLGGNQRQVLNPANRQWVDNPHFNPNYLDTARNIATWNRAYTEIMTQDINRHFRGILDEKVNPKTTREGKITKRKGANGPHSEAARHRKAEITREQSALTASKTLLEGAGIGITTYQEHVRRQRQTIEHSEEVVRVEERKVNIVDPAPPPAGYRRPANVTEALNLMLTETSVAFQLRIGREVIGSLVAESTQLEGDIETAYNTWYTNRIETPLSSANARLASATDEAVRNRINQEITTLEQTAATYESQLRTTRYKSRIDRYNRRLGLVSDASENIQNANDALTTAREELTDRFDPQRRSVESFVTRMQADRTAIEGWSLPAGVGGPAAIDLSTNALASETFDQLQQRINDAYNRAMAFPTPITDFGWPAAENNIPRNHERLVRAMVEARAIRLEPRLATPSADFTNTLTTYPFLTELDFIALSNHEIGEQIRINGGAAIAVPTVETVRAEAQARLNARQRALPEVIEQIENRERHVAEESSRVNEIGIISPDLEIIEKASGRFEAIIEEITSLPDAELIRRLDPALANTQPGYFAAEHGTPIVYANILRWVADTANDYDATYPGAQRGQAAAFQRASAFLTPAVIDAELTRAFGVNMANLQAEVTAGNISQTELANFIFNDLVIEYMEPRVEAA